MVKLIFNRRKFLFLGSAFSAGMFSPIPFKLLRSPTINKSTAAVVPQLLTNPVSVGFWQASSQLPSLQSLAWQPTQHQLSPTTNLVAAETLAQSDRAFLSEGARVQIQGLQLADNVQSLEVYAHYPAGVGYEAQKVCVWRFKATPISTASAPISFVVPVSQADGLKFSLVWQYRHADGSLSGEPEEAIAHFSLQSVANAPKLQRGVYLFAGRDAQTRQQPEWQGYQLQVIKSERADQRHQVVQVERSSTATFPYLLVALDYPSPRLGTSV
ncbi:hypothetical protein [Nostoc sp. FACHB-145]|uniref:hypothetical protein n=1 Tax=Nostoc sp. FACHB-145 TaxID=2692836 RepID=UPI00168774BA|nr:hypothetical protein [Nostoc sp. FACHB-145]MBD2472963.1 hypothetical protein [Nostoc sp. FACHB-145]